MRAEISAEDGFVEEHRSPFAGFKEIGAGAALDVIFTGTAAQQGGTAKGGDGLKFLFFYRLSMSVLIHSPMLETPLGHWLSKPKVKLTGAARLFIVKQP